jgi:dihydrofolate reductase
MAAAGLWGCANLTSMRQLRYAVAASLDGYIAGPNGEYDWIPMDPDIDFAAMFARYSGVVMGRKSYEVSAGGGMGPSLPTYVYSRTLEEGERDGVVFSRDAVTHVPRLKAEDGKPLWLWGGGELFTALAAARLVDGVDVAIVPVILGAGIPLMAAPGAKLTLRLREHTVYPKTGTVMLEYDVVR